METIVTPVNIDRYEMLLKESNFNPKKTQYLVSGFKRGFSLGYRGPQKVR